MPREDAGVTEGGFWWNCAPGRYRYVRAQEAIWRRWACRPIRTRRTRRRAGRVTAFMQRKSLLALIILVATACQGVPAPVFDNASDMHTTTVQKSKSMAVAPITVINERQDFIEKLVRTG